MGRVSEKIVQHIAIVILVFNDWASLSRLIEEIDGCNVPGNAGFSLFIINDGSTEPPAIRCLRESLRQIAEIELINVACNLGHQRAIAVGLVELSNHGTFSTILVMDSDGEDRPADIPRLCAEAEIHPGHIICAQRMQRSGPVAFRLWYECYKLIFRLLTGVQIDFGNFCLIPGDKLQSLINNSSLRIIWLEPLRVRAYLLSNYQASAVSVTQANRR